MHCDARLKAARRVGRSSEELHLRKQEASEVAIDPRDVRREEEDEDEDDDDDDDAYSVRPPVAPGPPRGRSAVGLAGSATPSLGDLNERAGAGGPVNPAAALAAPAVKDCLIIGVVRS